MENNRKEQQKWFIDANIFLEALIDEQSEWLDFLRAFRSSQKIAVTSTHAIGEVFRKLLSLEKDNSYFKSKESILAFYELLEKSGILIQNFSNNCFEIIKIITEYDKRLEFKDTLHLASAVDNSAVCFCSLDKGFSEQTVKKFRMKKVSSFQSYLSK